MAKYLLEANYTAEGFRGLMKDKATGRKVAVEKLLASMGGKLEGLFFALGESDVVILADLPDSVSAAAISIAVSASGAVTAKTTTLLTVEEIDQALGKTVVYTRPGAGARP